MRFARSSPSVLRVSALLAALVASALPAAAQQASGSASSNSGTIQPSSLALIAQLPARQVQLPQFFPARHVDEPRRPNALLPLYGSLIALQGLDIHSTRRALSSAGSSEANPVMEPFVRNSAAFIAVKAGATAGVIWASEKMWKKNRKAAVVFATAVNVAMAAIVANNYRVSR